MNFLEGIDLEEVLTSDEKKTKLRTLFFTNSSRTKDYGDDLFFQFTRIRTLILPYRSSIPTTIGKLVHLRYLHLYNLICHELPDTICDLYNLQTLDLTGSICGILPKNINKLSNLRCLNLSGCPVKELPDSICDLSKLHTLNLSMCQYLKRIPEGIGKLVELRDLSFFTCHALLGLPKGMVSLTNLYRLRMVLRLSKDTESYLNLEDLKLLRHVLKFQRYFAMNGCTYILNPSEAREIEMMESLHFLLLAFRVTDFEVPVEYEEGMEVREVEILEACKPTPNLRSLKIQNYMGLTISPKWMMSLVSLTELELRHCYLCTVLPPLGKLPSLEWLLIYGFEWLAKVGTEFLGIENTDIEENSSMTLFPKLKSLEFSNLRLWESWVGTTNTNAVIMPCLTRLYFDSCPIIKKLPDFLPLETIDHLNMDYCHYLERYRRNIDRQNSDSE